MDVAMKDDAIVKNVEMRDNGIAKDIGMPHRIVETRITPRVGLWSLSSDLRLYLSPFLDSSGAKNLALSCKLGVDIAAPRLYRNIKIHDGEKSPDWKAMMTKVQLLKSDGKSHILPFIKHLEIDFSQRPVLPSVMVQAFQVAVTIANNARNLKEMKLSAPTVELGQWFEPLDAEIWFKDIIKQQLGGDSVPKLTLGDCVSRCQVFPALVFAKGLQELTFSWKAYEKLETLPFLQYNVDFPQLTYLCIECKRFPTCTQTRMAGIKKPTGHTMDPESLLAITSHCPNLQELRLEGSWGFQGTLEGDVYKELLETVVHYKEAFKTQLPYLRRLLLPQLDWSYSVKFIQNERSIDFFRDYLWLCMLELLRSVPALKVVCFPDQIGKPIFEVHDDGLHGYLCEDVVINILVVTVPPGTTPLSAAGAGTGPNGAGNPQFPTKTSGTMYESEEMVKGEQKRLLSRKPRKFPGWPILKDTIKKHLDKKDSSSGSASTEGQTAS